MPFVIKRKMEKLGWADAVEKVGNPTLSEGSGSGLSGTDYFRLKREFCSLDDSEYVVCFTTGSTTSSVVQTIFHWEWVVTFELRADSFTVYTYDFATATSTDIATLSPNTKYWIKVNLDGCSKKISLSEDGISYNELISFTEKVVRPMQYLPTMGSHATLERPFLGVYHFNECVAKYTRRYLARDPRVGNSHKTYVSEMAPTYYNFTINSTPENAIVTINGEVTNSVTLAEGSNVEWSVSLDGYSTQSGSLVLNEDTVIDVVLEDTKYYTLTINAHQLDGYDISGIYINETVEGIKIYPDVIDTASGVAIFKITREEGSKVTCYLQYQGLLGDTSVVSFTFTEDKTVDVTFIERP